MGYHIMILNETLHHTVDLGKWLWDFKKFQMPNEVILKYLFEHQGEVLKIVNDGEDYDDYPEVDCWTKYLPKSK